MDAPDLDARSYDDIVAQTEALASAYTADTQAGPWLPRRDGAPDFGGVLVRLFATMVGHVTTQLNRAPDKHRLAFLQLLGATRTPPRAARAPVTFVLDEGQRTAVVPAGAEIAGANALGEPVVFETELELALTRARLAAVFVRDTGRQRYADRTARALGTEAAAYEALGAAPPLAAAADPANRAIEHLVYVRIDALDTPGASTLLLQAIGSAPLPPQPIAWSAFQQGRLVPLPAVTVSGNTWTLAAAASAIGAAPVNGVTARWLCGRLDAAPPPLRIAADVGITAPPEPVQHARANGQPADFTRDVLPFGERPRPGDVFYVGHDDAFALPNVTVVLAFTLTVPSGGVNANGISLQWETWDGEAAALIGTSTTAGPLAGAFADATKALTTNGNVVFTLAAPIPRSTVGGVPSRWVRVRIVAGNYGVDMSVTVGANNAITVNPATFRPPAIASLKISWSATRVAPPSRVLRRTALTFEDLGADPGTPQVLYRAAPELAYQASADTTPSLHLGFDRAFERQATTLYVQVVPAAAPAPGSFVEPPAPRRPLVIAWEYWNGTRWTPLGAQDGTQGLTRSGLVRFVAPADTRPLAQFGQTLHWLRARAATDDFSPMPLLGRVLLNTVWASHARTHALEVLGTSAGGRNQVFHLSQRPVLEGQWIEVAEPEPPPASELAALAATEPGPLVSIEQDPDRSPVAWVRWHAVSDFWASGPRDRHYMIDAETGRVAFGDGTRGMVPPTGQGNIRARRYRAGGGPAGNIPAGSLVRLKTTVPVVSAVGNPEPAIGGAATETLQAMTGRASRALRHGGRAVTVDDYADLALEASTDVARAVALVPSFDPTVQGDGPDTSAAALHRDGLVIVVIVPASAVPGAAPPDGLRDLVADHLRARCPPGARVEVTGPTWVAADITVHIAPRSLDEGPAVLARAREAIARLLDPTRGGDGSGWPFGRRPRNSDIVAALDGVPGLDHLSFIDVACEPPLAEPTGEAGSIDELSMHRRLLVYARTIAIGYPGP